MSNEQSKPSFFCLAGKMRAISERLNAVGKEGRGQDGGRRFAFRRLEDLVVAFREACGEEKIGFVMTVKDSSVQKITYSSFLAAVTVVFSFYEEDGDGRLDVTWPGSGIGMPSKAMAFAFANAQKTMLTKLFLVGSDDPDEEAVVEPARKEAGQEMATRQQIAKITMLETELAHKKIEYKIPKPLEAMTKAQAVTTITEAQELLSA